MVNITRASKGEQGRARAFEPRLGGFCNAGLLALIVAASGCPSDDTGGSGDGGADSTGGVDPIEGDQCGEGVGFVTRCWADAITLKIGATNNIASAKTITNPFGSASEEFGLVCCEGRAPQATADEECTDLCMRQACSAARSLHTDMVQGTHLCFSSDCGFDEAACETGNWHQQTIDFVFGADQHYFLQAQCEDSRTNEPYTDGVFEWNQQPVNDPGDDASICIPAAAPEKDTHSTYPDHRLIEDAGTSATIQWTGLIGSGSATEDIPQVVFSYDAYDCGTQQRCIQLGDFRVEVPDRQLEGVSISDATLDVFATASADPVIASNGEFTYPVGSMRAMLSAKVDGVPVHLVRSNTAPVVGIASPAADTLHLPGIVFDYSDTSVSASLQLDVLADYTRRSPTAVIAPLNVPRACSQGVTFRAASSDPDGAGLTHVWWVPSKLLVTSGQFLTTPLPPGQHRITLISTDPTQQYDATTLLYNRSCQ